MKEEICSGPYEILKLLGRSIEPPLKIEFDVIIVAASAPNLPEELIKKLKKSVKMIVFKFVEPLPRFNTILGKDVRIQGVLLT